MTATMTSEQQATATKPNSRSVRSQAASQNLGSNQVDKVEDCWQADLQSHLFPPTYEFVPNTTEIFEWELALMESTLLSPEELVARGAYFARINGQETHHYRLCLSNAAAIHKGKSIATQSHFKAGQFSAGYGVDGLFPYRGKFHAQLAKAIINVMGLKPGDTLLDPMAGSGTACLEARLMGINSIGFDISPFCTLMSEAKRLAMEIDPALLERAVPDQQAFLEFMARPGAATRLPVFVTDALSVAAVPHTESTVAAACKLLQLIYLDAMGYARRRKNKTLHDVFPKVFDRYLATIASFRAAAATLNLRFGRARFETASALALPLANESVDGALTSPPYSFAIDYADNDRPQLEFLGYNVDDLKNRMIGLRGGGKAEKVALYFEDMRTMLSEMFRVLKPGKMCVVIIGSNDIQTGGIRHEAEVKKAAKEVGFESRKEILKPIKGMRNTMREEFILFFQKPSQRPTHHVVVMEKTDAEKWRLHQARQLMAEAGY